MSTYAFEAEAAFRALVAVSPLAVVAFDPDGRITIWNAAAEELTGWTAAEVAGGTRPFVSADELESLAALVRRGMDGERQAQAVVRLRRRDGSRIVLRTSSTELRDAGGTVVGIASFCTDPAEEDISEEERARVAAAHRETEETLRETRDALAAVVANIPGAAYRCVYDESWTMELLTDGIEMLTGYPASDFIGNAVRTYASIVHPEDRAGEAEIHEAVREGRPYALESRIVHADGSIRWLLDRGRAVYGPGGEVLGLDGVLLDITRLKEAEDAVRTAKEMLTALVEAAPLAIIAYDRSGIVTGWNPAAEEMLGWSAAEAVGRFSPMSRDAREEFEGYLERVLAGESWRGVEIERLRADGQSIVLHASSAPLRDGRGDIVGMVSLYADLTDRKRAERALAEAELRYRALVEHLPLAVYEDELNESSSALYLSPQIVPMLGYALEEWLSDPDFFPSVLHPDDRERVLAENRESIAIGSRFCSDYRLVAKDGRVVWVHDENVPVRDPEGRPIRAQGFLLDITERKAAEAEIRRQNERLREVDRLKDEFIALVSHELRTPLTSIIGYLELVLEGESGPLTEQQDRFLRVIARNGERLQRLVGDLLFIAQVDAGRVALETAPVDLRGVALEAVEAATPAAEAKGVSLELDARPVPPLLGDHSKLAQLLDNLVSNAIKFTPAGGRVGVALSRRNGHARLEVADTGIGIPEDELGRLFERFFRTSTATRFAVQGTGLGLAITKAIAESHGGRLGVESAEGVGTTFWVELPLPTERGDQSFGHDLHRAA